MKKIGSPADQWALSSPDQRDSELGRREQSAGVQSRLSTGGGREAKLQLQLQEAEFRQKEKQKTQRWQEIAGSRQEEQDHKKSQQQN